MKKKTATTPIPATDGSSIPVVESPTSPVASTSSVANVASSSTDGSVEYPSKECGKEGPYEPETFSEIRVLCSTCTYQENGTIRSISCVMVSDYLTHDTVAVSYFIKQLMPIIKSKVLPERVFYFSDGAAAQYKNRKNFANLSCHKADHGMPAEWHFFATAHGKGPCDGIGGTLKRLATKASLQRTLDNQIQTPYQLYEWAEENLQGIITVFCSKQEIADHETKLKTRLEHAVTVPGTQKLHAFSSVDGQKKLLVKRYSYASESRTVNILKA